MPGHHFLPSRFFSCELGQWVSAKWVLGTVSGLDVGHPQHEDPWVLGTMYWELCVLGF